MKTVLQTSIDYLENELKSLRWSNERMVIMGFAGREFQLIKDINYLKTLLLDEKEQIKSAYTKGFGNCIMDNGTSVTHEQYYKATYTL